MLRSILLAIFSFILCLRLLADVRIENEGKSAKLMVDGTPMLILGGELGNSSATSVEDIARIFPKLRRMQLNTVLVPAYWHLLEPVEGQYDFSLTDAVVDHARQNDLKVVFLWFGAWKNSMSCYAPLWFKKNFKKYPRARTRAGEPLEIACAFSENVFRADSTAFVAWLRHLEAYDDSSTVLAVQIENEIGMLGDARDHSPLAAKAYAEGVPAALADYLNENADRLHPYLKSRMLCQHPAEGMGWSDVFGGDVYGDEIFMAYGYARYVERLARAAKELSSRPVYVNAALDSRGRRPGEYPSAGPLAKLIDIWHAAAPHVDFLSPDIYDKGFTSWVAGYALPGNPLFVPEIRLSEHANAPQAFYAFCEHNAIGLSPFSIENGKDGADAANVEGYRLLRELSPLIISKQGTGEMNGLYFDQDSTLRTIRRDGLQIRARHYFTLPWDPRATDGSPWPESGGAIIRLSPMEYIVAGSGIVVEFEDALRTESSPKNLGEDGFAQSGSATSEAQPWAGGRKIGIGSVAEVRIGPDGQLVPVRHLCGDETHQGRHVRIGVDDYKTLHVILYEYE